MGLLSIKLSSHRAIFGEIMWVMATFMRYTPPVTMLDVFIAQDGTISVMFLLVYRGNGQDFAYSVSGGKAAFGLMPCADLFGHNKGCLTFEITPFLLADHHKLFLPANPPSSFPRAGPHPRHIPGVSCMVRLIIDAECISNTRFRVQRLQSKHRGS